MRIPCGKCGRKIEVSEAAILSAAAKIWVGRRKVHRGAHPKPRPCQFCGEVVLGMAALVEHEDTCPARRALRAAEPSDFRPAPLERFEFAD